jgi:class 3 adenylate cyclase
MDLSAWLRGLGLEQYEQAFRDNAIDPDMLPRLTAEDLKELGVTLVGHRRKLLDAIAALRGNDTQASETAGPALAPATSPIDAIGERRQVTVLFADLAGYTAWGQQLDAEEVHALLEQFFDRADRAIQEHGGHIDKHIGDCVMAVFGVLDGVDLILQHNLLRRMDEAHCGQPAPIGQRPGPTAAIDPAHAAAKALQMLSRLREYPLRRRSRPIARFDRDQRRHYPLPDDGKYRKYANLRNARGGSTRL